MSGGATATRLQRRRTRAAWLLLLPALVLLAGVAGYPLLRTLALAFTDASLAGLEEPSWVGLANFAYALNDPEWWRAVRNTLVFTAASVVLQLGLGLGIALLLNALLRGRGPLTAAMLVPWAIPTVVVAQLWRWIYHDLYGVLNDLLLRLGLIEAPVAWLADDALAMAAVVIADVWKATPFMALLLLAGLQTIPTELHEAARVDGAGPVTRFRTITLPLLLPAMAVALIFRTLDALRVFDLIYVMTSNSRATASVSVYARQQLIEFQDAGYGSAVSVLIVVLVGLFTVAYAAGLRPHQAVQR